MSTLIVIAKEPVPGRVKTRLTPPFTPEQAAELARAALADTLEAVASARFQRRLLVLEGDAASVDVPVGFRVLPQVGGGLDRRLAAAFHEAAAFDAGPVLLVGMDTPQVTGPLLEACMPTALEDATIGPAEDGGFWSLGFRSPRDLDLDRLMFDVPMSTDTTGAVQLGRLTEAGLRVRILPTLRDVDTVADLQTVAAAAPASRFAGVARAAVIKQHLKLPVPA
jgi:rSAM/selenodomain-associated transferase 1